MFSLFQLIISIQRFLIQHHGKQAKNNKLILEIPNKFKLFVLFFVEFPNKQHHQVSREPNFHSYLQKFHFWAEESAEMYGEDDARKLLLVKIGVLGCVCLVFSLLVHGPYSVDTTTFHYGIWRYCIEATDNCSPVGKIHIPQANKNDLKRQSN